MGEETSLKSPAIDEFEREREREKFLLVEEEETLRSSTGYHDLQFSQTINLNRTKIRSLCVLLQWRMNDETKLGFEEIEVLTNRLPLKLLLRVESVFKDVELVFSTVGIGGDLPEDSAIY